LNENNDQVQSNHTRMGFGMTAKGFVQLDVTVSYETPEIAAEQARKALTSYKEICKEQNLKLADTAA
jgi:hypothetical protein